MIILHRKLEGAESDRLEERLKDLVVSFKTKSYESNETELPFIEEDGREYRTEDEINEWFSELSSELGWQRSLSGDGATSIPKAVRSVNRFFYPLILFPFGL